MPHAQTTLTRLRGLVISVLFLALLANAFGIDLNRLRQSFNFNGGSEKNFNDWQNLITEADSLPIEAKLQKVNQFFNRKIIYTEDMELWGQTDYWATPMESLGKGRGDCEDYVIAKYFSLRSLSVPDQQLRLIYVKAKVGGAHSSVQQAHMILAFYPDHKSEPLILDNLISEIRPASRRSDLNPVFSFNSQGVFTGNTANADLGIGGTSRLSRWHELLNRARKEGFD